MTDASYDRASWEARWEQALVQHGDKLASMPPNDSLVSTATGLPPGNALDAGCGHGAESMWLAAAGWRVTAVDFAAAALDHARSTAESLGGDLAERIEWVEGDLGTWTPAARTFDLVSCLYVHVAGSVAEMVTRLGSGVAPGGTLLLVGHLPVDPETGQASAAAGQNQVTVEQALAALDPSAWDVVVAETRQRRAALTGADALVQATRRS